jgi:queuine/archaeosine tRNA-ribosyltransferase
VNSADWALADFLFLRRPPPSSATPSTLAVASPSPSFAWPRMPLVLTLRDPAVHPDLPGRSLAERVLDRPPSGRVHATPAAFAAAVRELGVDATVAFHDEARPGASRKRTANCQTRTLAWLDATLAAVHADAGVESGAVESRLVAAPAAPPAKRPRPETPEAGAATGAADAGGAALTDAGGAALTDAGGAALTDAGGAALTETGARRAAPAGVASGPKWAAPAGVGSGPEWAAAAGVGGGPKWAAPAGVGGGPKWAAPAGMGGGPKWAAPAVLGVVVGGVDVEARARMTAAVCERRVAGLWLAELGLGESAHERAAAIDAVVAAAPPALPRLVAGVGEPRAALDAVARGIDVFDTDYPHAAARDGLALAFPLGPEDGAGPAGGRLALRDQTLARDPAPLVRGCPCRACTDHTRAYVHHLLGTHELLGDSLLHGHNLTHYARFFARMRAELAAGTFPAYAAWFHAAHAGPAAAVRGASEAVPTA